MSLSLQPPSLERKCRDCAITLTEANWPPYMRRNYAYLCRKCKNKRDWSYEKGKPTKLQRLRGRIVAEPPKTDLYIPPALSMSWEYVAGFFDAEGSAPRINGELQYLTFTNCNISVLKELRKFLNAGHIYQHVKEGEIGAGGYARHACFYIRVGVQSDVARIAFQLIPYARVKHAILTEILQKRGIEFPREKKQLTWPFATGFLDGDGGFRVHLDTYTSPFFSNTHYGVIHDLHTFVGAGSLYNDLRINQDGTTTTFYELRLGNRQVKIRAVKAMLPYMRINRDKAASFTRKVDVFKPNMDAESILDEDFNKKLYLWKLKGLGPTRIAASTWMDRTSISGIMRRYGIQ